MSVLNRLSLCGFVFRFIFYLGLVDDLFSFFICHVGLLLGFDLSLVFFFYCVGLFFAFWGLIWSRFVLCHVGFDLVWVCSLSCGFVFGGKKRKEIECVRLDFH